MRDRGCTSKPVAPLHKQGHTSTTAAALQLRPSFLMLKHLSMTQQQQQQQ
jgi:hypothetical protein